MKSDSKLNRLAGEKSPYLLQHASNPVDWYPWGDEAFEKARKEDRPLFISIGYATCHWCHVMEDESFSDDEVASLLNDCCVSVKVDREERPDIDGTFMAVCQMMNGNGGWPLNVMVTPEGLPFFAATYLPKRGSAGRPGLVDLVPRVKWLWKTQREQVEESAESIAEKLRNAANPEPGSIPGSAVINAAYREMESSFDAEWGGFSSEPKFPMASWLLFLSVYGQRMGEEKAFVMADKTMEGMWKGGIHDHLGGGFARYATDRQWNVPHFEKMLYDQALLLYGAAEFQSREKKDLYENFAEDIAGFVLGEMTSPEGGFYSAFDADSEGEEGKYYLWTEEEIRSLLPSDEAGVFLSVYGARKGGNFRNEVTGRILGDNVLYLAMPLKEAASKFSLELPKLASVLASCRTRLLEARKKRTPPLLDDKILTDWNGLMIAALARAGAVFSRPEWIAAAQKAARFIDTKLRDKEGGLLHRYRGKDASIPGFLDDYAFYMWGLLELGAATEKSGYSENAGVLLDAARRNFEDEKKGGFFTSRGDDTHLFLRRKEAYDGAIPSGNAVMLANALRLAALPGRKDCTALARSIAEAFGKGAEQYPLSHAWLLASVMKL
ncbi:MAG: thioredoxin domain-containing protein [Synergistaceae bacterium]|nr:thioredoxin domain-containing protein [Synergistaceae bacterium]